MRIVVAGAGPAGVAIAVQLAGLGHDVTVLAPPGRRHAVEGVSFRVLDGLRVAGLAEAEADVAAKLSGDAFGDAGQRVVIEEGLVGEECSLLVLCDGRRLAALAPAQDFKRLGDGDAGPNTGGMGAYSPVAFVDDA